MTILLIIAGYVLERNGQWFNGAENLGHWLFIGGIVLLIIEVVIYILIAAGVFRAIRK